MFRIQVQVTDRTEGLKNAARTYVTSLNNTLDALGRHLQRSLRGRVRRNVGDEARNIKQEVRGTGLSKILLVFGDIVQIWIDENGLDPGVFAPWGPGSRLFRYVSQKNLTARPEKDERPSIARRRARKASHLGTRRPRARSAGGTQPSAPTSGPRIKQPRSRRVAAAPANPEERRQARKRASREKVTRRVAFLIARAIFERGIKAGRPIARTFEANRSKIIRDVANAFVRATNSINRGQ